jgi:predicted regulator of Ras-like GTPase activity (Roadblock/LC7/MglB family)
VTADLLSELNKVPGVLGSAYVTRESIVSDLGEAVGGEHAAQRCREVVAACRNWSSLSGSALDRAVFVGEHGRIVVQPAGAGTLVAFTENATSAGLLRLKMRETSQRIKEMEGE